MSDPVLLRIDDRLLHGQVLVAWAAALRPRRIVLASDDVVQDAERRALYEALPQEDYELAVRSLDEAAGDLGRAAGRGERLLVVCASPADALRLVELGAPLAHVNVGGLHLAEGKRRLLEYVYLSRQDVQALRALLERGLHVEARDLPGSRPVQLDAASLARLWD
jgi:mannose/fructose/N-acetylgalactosamine-specific phosphotransferase system component IIB